MSVLFVDPSKLTHLNLFEPVDENLAKTFRNIPMKYRQPFVHELKALWTTTVDYLGEIMSLWEKENRTSSNRWSAETKDELIALGRTLSAKLDWTFNEVFLFDPLSFTNLYFRMR